MSEKKVSNARDGSGESSPRNYDERYHSVASSQAAGLVPPASATALRGTDQGESSPRNYDERYQSLASSQAAGLVPPSNATTLRGTDQGLSPFTGGNLDGSSGKKLERRNDAERPWKHESVATYQAASPIPPTTTKTSAQTSEMTFSGRTHGYQEDDPKDAGSKPLPASRSLSRKDPPSMSKNNNKSNHKDKDVKERARTVPAKAASLVDNEKSKEIAFAAHRPPSPKKTPPPAVDEKRELALAPGLPAYRRTNPDASTTPADPTLTVKRADSAPSTESPINTTATSIARAPDLRPGAVHIPGINSGLHNDDDETAVTTSPEQDSSSPPQPQEDCILEAQLVKDESVVVARPADEPPLAEDIPWWRKSRNILVVIIVLLIAVLAILGATGSFGGGSSPSPGGSSSSSLSPTSSPLPTGMPSLRPTSRPSFSGRWVQLGNDINGSFTFDQFGASVSLSADGSVIAVGADEYDGNGFDSGQVRIHRLESDQWTQIGNSINGSAAGDEFGFALSLSANGTIVAVGAYKHAGENGINSGEVRIHRIEDGQWLKVGDPIEGEAQLDLSGYSVDLSADGSVVAVGAKDNRGNGFAKSGHVRIHRLVDGQWLQVGTDINGAESGDESGNAVSLSADGTVVAVASYLNNVNGPDSGHARLFRLEDREWVQLGRNINGASANAHFGASISLSANGDVVALGGNNYNEATGHVQVYRLDNQEEWIQLGQNLTGDGVGDNFGKAVSLSDDGSILAIGADQDFSTDPSAPGYVRVFRLSGEFWQQIGDDLLGTEARDQFGWSVSLSSDGATVAVGALYNNPNGVTSAGHVRVFQLEE